MRHLLFIWLLIIALTGWGCKQDASSDHEDILQARESFSKGLYLEAEKSYERYLQVEPQGEHREEAWNRLSKIAVNVKSDMDRAVVLLEAMHLELGTDSEKAWKIMFQLGDVYAQLRNLPKAIESFEKCLIYATNSSEHTYKTLLRMAKLYRSMGNYEMVAVTLENCTDTAVGNEAKARCLYELAQSYNFIANWSQSRRALEALLALDGVSPERLALSVFLLADIYENERNYQKTKELLESILTTYPNPKVVESRLANLPYVPAPEVPPRPPSN